MPETVQSTNDAVILVVLIWICTMLISDKIAHNVSEIIFKAIEGNINQFVENRINSNS